MTFELEFLLLVENGKEERDSSLGCATVFLLVISCAWNGSWGEAEYLHSLLHMGRVPVGIDANWHTTHLYIMSQ